MAKPKKAEPPEKKKPKPDWDKIRVEYDLGQLSYEVIAELYGDGISKQAIIMRARRQGWPPRPERTAVVTDVVTREALEVTTVTPRFALSAFERVIKLLGSHRVGIQRVRDEITLCLQDLADYRARAEKVGRPLRLDEIETIASVTLKLSAALARMVPLERKAFGITDAEGPSEFDLMSDEQLKAIEDQVRRAIL